MPNLESVNGIAVMGSWNTDGGVSRHTTPLIEWLHSQGYRVKVFTHYKKSPFGMPLNVKMKILLPDVIPLKENLFPD